MNLACQIGRALWAGLGLALAAFSQDKSTRFNVAGNDQWHTYRLFPFWHPEGKIVRLRFDVYDGATFAVDFIRIAPLSMPPPT